MKRTCNNCIYKHTNYEGVEYCNNKSLKDFLYSNIERYHAELVTTEDGRRITIEDITKTVGNPCEEWDYDGINK